MGESPLHLLVGDCRILVRDEVFRDGIQHGNSMKTITRNTSTYDFGIHCLGIFSLALVCLGCHNHKPRITAVSLNNDCHYGQETGIPFYLPKPLLVISKNFRNIEEAKVGLTDTPPIPNGFDDQSKYADVNARTNFNFDGGGTTGNSTPSTTNTGEASKSGQNLHSQQGAPISPFKAPSDGLGPDTFYTYHIIFVPDLTQKYGLRIRGGPGEIRAAMNLVNGWQYTGMGPYYAKDSSTAQNILSGGIAARLGGQAANDVLSGVASLMGPAGGTQSGGQFDADDRRIQKLSETIMQLPGNVAPMTIPAFAEIHVFEPSLGPDGTMMWNEIANCVFNREYLGVKKTEKQYHSPQTDLEPLPGASQSGGRFETDSRVAQQAIASIFGVTPDSAALQQGQSGLQSGGEMATVPSGGVNQVNVNYNDPAPSAKGFGWLKMPQPFHHLKGKHQQRGKVERKLIQLPATASFVPGGAINSPLGGSGPTGLNDPGMNDPGLNDSGGSDSGESAGGNL